MRLLSGRGWQHTADGSLRVLHRREHFPIRGTQLCWPCRGARAASGSACRVAGCTARTRRCSAALRRRQRACQRAARSLRRGGWLRSGRAQVRAPSGTPQARVSSMRFGTMLCVWICRRCCFSHSSRPTHAPLVTCSSLTAQRSATALHMVLACAVPSLRRQRSEGTVSLC